MSDFQEALDAALTARYRWGEPKRPITHGQGRHARMNRLQQALGGDRKAAAKAAGIPYSTWGHMLKGTRAPSPKNLAKLEAAFTRLVMRPAMAAAIAKKGYPKYWPVTAEVVCDPGPKGSRYKNTTVYRKFKAEKLNGAHIVNAWLHHGAEGAAQAYLNEVARVYGSPFAFEGDNVEVDI